MPPATAQANTVLSAFTRSCSADGGKVWGGKFLPHPLSAAGGERVGERSDAGVSLRLRSAQVPHFTPPAAPIIFCILYDLAARFSCKKRTGLFS